MIRYEPIDKLLSRPLDTEYENLCLSEIVSKSCFAIDCIHHLVNPDDGTQNRRTVNLFECIYSHLYLTSNVALMLWPSEKGKKKNQIQFRKHRAEHLRRRLKIPENHLLQDRSFRNDIAHMDERLDEWWLTSVRRNISRQGYSTRERIIRFDTKDIFEHYIYDEKVFIFRGREYDLKASAAALEDIRDKAVAHVGLPWSMP